MLDWVKGLANPQQQCVHAGVGVIHTYTCIHMYIYTYMCVYIHIHVRVCECKGAPPPHTHTCVPLRIQGSSSGVFLMGSLSPGSLFHGRDLNNLNKIEYMGVGTCCGTCNAVNQGPAMHPVNAKPCAISWSPASPLDCGPHNTHLSVRPRPAQGGTHPT